MSQGVRGHYDDRGGPSGPEEVGEPNPEIPENPENPQRLGGSEVMGERYNSQSVFLRLAKELGLQGRELGRRLGVHESAIEMIIEENRRVVDQNYKILIKWTQKLGDGARRKDLMDALIDIDRSDLL
eukprot:m.110634 g.110634  ORF g.110634 m.110634 type:complete len:127 (+) comp37412_c0_seq2:10616-10996(+)